MKRDLLKVQEQTSTAATSPKELPDSTRFTRQALQSEAGGGKVCPDILPRSCIFCSKTKYQRNSRTREKLADCMESRADSTIKQAALARKDDKILAMVMSKDLTSSEAKYHKSCYKVYVRTNYVQPATESDTRNEEENDYKRIESQAFESIMEYCIDLIEQPRLVEFVEIRAILTDELEKNAMAKAGVRGDHHATKRGSPRKGMAKETFNDRIFRVERTKGKRQNVQRLSPCSNPASADYRSPPCVQPHPAGCRKPRRCPEAPVENGSMKEAKERSAVPNIGVAEELETDSARPLPFYAAELHG
eukprot:Seg7404.5 transcript_id=Seg7404.5/GoldUCD/mRNA.D3Y31 product="hypothetical protein" protein_id=Seg7404.5/GoldUCD/D3Y31